MKVISRQRLRKYGTVWNESRRFWVSVFPKARMEEMQRMKNIPEPKSWLRTETFMWAFADWHYRSRVMAIKPFGRLRAKKMGMMCSNV